MILQLLHPVYLGVLFVVICIGCGAWVRRWLGLPAVFLLPLGFGCTGLAGLAAFFAWWISPALGNAVSLALGLGAVALFASGVPGASSMIREDLRSQWRVVAATLLLATSWICLLLAGGEPASKRFTWELPVDDQLPRIFAEKLAAGESPTPLSAEWLSSDRPPLQAGVVLLMRPFAIGSADPGLAYQTIATLCQLMWLPALVALGTVAGLGSRQIAAGLLFSSTAAFFLVNSLYAWPKLMSAAVFLTGVAVLLRLVSEPGPRASRLGLPIGALLALATLAHGGAWFSVLALPAIPAAWTGLRKMGTRGAILLALGFGAVKAPWSAYSAFVDPPGNRLVKWHLAGVIAVDDRSSFEALRDAYASKGPGELLRDRLENLLTVVRVPPKTGDETWSGYIRRIQFFHVLPAVGMPLLGVGWLALARIRNRLAGRSTGELLVYSAATLFLWCMLVFIPGSTIVHAGSYVPLALLIFLGGAAVGEWHPQTAACIAITHGAIFLAGWILTTPVAEGASLSAGFMTCAAILMLGFLSLLSRLARPPASVSD